LAPEWPPVRGAPGSRLSRLSRASPGVRSAFRAHTSSHTMADRRMVERWCVGNEQSRTGEERAGFRGREGALWQTPPVERVPSAPAAAETSVGRRWRESRRQRRRVEVHKDVSGLDVHPALVRAAPGAPRPGPDLARASFARCAGADYTLLRWCDAMGFVLATIAHSATHIEQAPRRDPAEEAPAPPSFPPAGFREMIVRRHGSGRSMRERRCLGRNRASEG